VLTVSGEPIWVGSRGWRRARQWFLKKSKEESVWMHNNGPFSSQNWLKLKEVCSIGFHSTPRGCINTQNHPQAGHHLYGLPLYFRKAAKKQTTEC